jgi:anti-sigma B factor antagonist
MAAFDIRTRIRGDRCTLGVSGELDAATASLFADVGIAKIQDPTVVTLVVDLVDLVFLDSMGMGALVRIRNMAQGLAKDVYVSNPQERVHRVLSITGLDQVFYETYPEL